MKKNIFTQNPFCKLLGIKYPIIQGGMAWISDATLAASVSEAGGLGIIAAMSSNGEHLRAQIREAKKLTKKPFGVNIMLLSPHVDEVARVVVEEKISVITTGAGMPGKYMKDWVDAGIKVFPLASSVSFAKFLSRGGAAGIICEGTEAGGHIGELTTMALVPQVCDALDLPIAAAGGIADGRGLAAAFALGARAVQIGTRFLVAKECGIHQNYKDKILKAKDSDTMVTGRRTGHPVRLLKTEFAREFLKIEADTSLSDEDLLKLGSGALRLAAVEGNIEKGSFMAGQIAGLVKKEQTCAEIIEEIVNDAEKIFKTLNNIKGEEL